MRTLPSDAASGPGFRAHVPVRFMPLAGSLQTRWRPISCRLSSVCRTDRVAGADTYIAQTAGASPSSCSPICRAVPSLGATAGELRRTRSSMTSNSRWGATSIPRTVASAFPSARRSPGSVWHGRRSGQFGGSAGRTRARTCHRRKLENLRCASIQHGPPLCHSRNRSVRNLYRRGSILCTGSIGGSIPSGMIHPVYCVTYVH